jgi:hypothetical protein
MFIFVGISTILGIDEFGYKKFIARLLIVAILINFSLFFTKITIDISHALAGTFYKALGVQIEGTNTGGGIASGSNEAFANSAGNNLTGAKGIAGAFMTAMGISGTYTAQKNELIKIGEQADSTFMILWVAILTTIMLIALAVVLFYGCFLLGTRGVLLIFLLLSSSFAFGSFMIPKFRDHDYGWKGWIDTLIRSALFAPLFLLFLWMVLFVLRQVPASAKSNVAGFAVDATNPAVWTSTIIYILSLGLLYVSMKVAKSFSSNVGIMSSSFKFADMTAGAGKSAVIFARNRNRFNASERAQATLASGTKDKLIARANAGGVGGYAAQVQLNRLQKQAKGEFGMASAAITTKLDNYAKSWTQGAGKGGAAARAAEHEKHEIEKIEKGITTVAPSKEAEKKVLETGMQEAKSAIKAEYQKALDDHKANNQALKDSEAEVERDEKEIETITKKVTEGNASAQDIARKNNLALNVKAVASKIAITKAAINADREKGIKSFSEAIDEHVEKTMDQTHGKVIQDSLKRAKSKIEDMKNENRDLYLTRTVSNPVRRDQMRSALKSSADDKKLKAAAKAFAKLSGAAEPAPQAAPSAPAPGTPAANPPTTP